MEKLMQYVQAYKKTVGGFLLGILVVSTSLFAVPQKTEGAPVILFVVAVSAAFVVVDAVSCSINLLFGCPGGGNPGSGGPGGPNGGPGGIHHPGGDNGGNNNGGTGNTNNGGGTGPTACSSVDANTCGMHGTGFVINGVCSATTPADSLCPTPSVGNFSAHPSLVKKGETSTLTWSVTSATLCAIAGGGLSLSNLPINGTQATGAVNQKTNFTLTCKNGLTGPAISQTATVGIIPVLKEI